MARCEAPRPDGGIVTKVLMVLTSHADLGDTGHKTGYYLPEVAHPWKVFTEAGYQVDFVSPKGGEAPMDGVDPSDPVQQAFLDDPDVAAALRSTLAPEQANPSDYDVIFYAGGHGTMWDFPDNTQLAKVAAEVYEGGGVVAALCHGPAGLVNVRLSDGSYLVAGKEVSAFTNEEETAVGLTEVVPFLLQTKLTERGARHTGTENFAAYVVADGRLVTGQNPASATGVAERVVELLAKQQRA
jgi:putative intracellular protease/amidase